MATRSTDPMTRHRHERQRPRHEYRHGINHFLLHFRGKKHPHKRRVVTDADRRTKSVRRGVVIIAIAGTFVIVALSIFSVSRSLKSAHKSLVAAQTSIDSIDSGTSALLTSEGRTRARSLLEQASAQSASAQAAMNDSFLTVVLAKIPIAGAEVRGVFSLADDSYAASREGISLLNQVDILNSKSSGTTISLTGLTSLQKGVSSSAVTLAALEHSAGWLYGPVRSARVSFNARISKVVTELGRGESILGFMSSFLGGNGPRNYLLATENQAEMRDQGSILSVGQIYAVAGHISLDTPQSVDKYLLSQPVSIPIPLGTEKVFGPYQPTLLWQSANATADFPWSGSDLTAMASQTIGVANDGVIAVDVHALAALLKLTGPVTVPDIAVPVSAGNAESLLLNTEYRNFPVGNQTARKDSLAAVARATIDLMSHEHIDVAQLAHTLSLEVAGRHLLLYDTHPRLEAILNRYGASGAIDVRNPTRTFHLAIENSTATKLDYFISTTIKQQVVITSPGTAQIATTVTVTNHAPTHQAPTYQFGPDNIASHTPGQYVGVAFLWAPRGSQAPNSVSESGLELSSANLNILPGENQTVTFRTNISNAVTDGSFDLTWIPQPTVHPQAISVTAFNQSHLLTGLPNGSISLVRPTTFHWFAG